MNETEIKVAIKGRAAFERLCARVGAGHVAASRQTNHFFDTADRSLAARGVTVRLREEAGRWMLTVKGPESAAGNVVSRAEHEVALDAASARALLDGSRSPADFAPALIDSDTELVHLGSFVNERRRVALELAGRDCELELDHTHFGARSDYELEVETDPEHASAVESAVLDLLRASRIRFGPSRAKVARFLEDLGS